jgi:hypothetical protein
MLGVSTENGRDLLGDSYFNFRILLKPMVKNEGMGYIHRNETFELYKKEHRI